MLFFAFGLHGLAQILGDRRQLAAFIREFLAVVRLKAVIDLMNRTKASAGKERATFVFNAGADPVSGRVIIVFLQVEKIPSFYTQP